MSSSNTDHTDVNKESVISLIGLSMLLGASLPLLIKNMIMSVAKNRFLHYANAFHSLLYIGISVITIYYKLEVPTDCFMFRKAQSILFNVYVLSYEFVLANKAKTILSRRSLFCGITIVDLLFVVSLLIRVGASVGTILTTQVISSPTDPWLCTNEFHPIWIHINNFSRNILEFIWSLLFIVPIYHVLSSAQHWKFYTNVNDTAYKQIFIANCAYPLIANMISTVISVHVMLHFPAPWSALLYGVQNFVSSYSVNLILNVTVDGTSVNTRYPSSQDNHSDYSDEASPTTYKPPSSVVTRTSDTLYHGSQRVSTGRSTQRGSVTGSDEPVHRSSRHPSYHSRSHRS